MRNGTIARRMGAWLAGAALLGACDAPTDPSRGQSATAGGPSLLLSPACAVPGGQEHRDTVRTAQTWTRANSPHRVKARVVVAAGGRVTIAPGAVVCVEPYGGLYMHGGRLYARGRDTAQIVFTARDAAYGWLGMQFSDAPGTTSYLTNVRIEHVALNNVAVASFNHPVYLDSAVIRQSGSAVSLYGVGSRMIRSRVDTTTNRRLAAVYLGSGARLEQTVVRRAAGVGVELNGHDVLLSGGRIEGSGGVGLHSRSDIRLSTYSRGVRITGGGSYPAALAPAALARLYGTPALQDSLRGNARDTVVVYPGVLQSAFTLGPRVPLLVSFDSVVVGTGGNLVVQPGARMAFGEWAWMRFEGGGRLYSRGTAAAPVVLTADDPARGWGGLRFGGSVSTTSYVTNTHVEHVSFYSTALRATDSHRLLVDSAVIRQSGSAVELRSQNSRISRTRVDTTLYYGQPAVVLAANARMESTLVHASSGIGVHIQSPTVVVASCEVRGGVYDGIVMDAPVAVHNCNLVDNGGVGIRNYGTAGADLRSNWWGSTGGPVGPGGDGVTGPHAASPWRTTPFVLPYVP